MSEYVCPHCRGGFPDPDGARCPWCGTRLNRDYEAETVKVARTTSDGDSRDGDTASPLEQIFGFGGSR